jgi:hypothetical protein
LILSFYLQAAEERKRILDNQSGAGNSSQNVLLDGGSIINKVSNYYQLFSIISSTIIYLLIFVL